MKTVAKYFPFLETAQQYSCDEIFTHCFMTTDKKSVHKKLLEFKERVKVNYEIMQLYEPNISYSGKEKIRNTINNFNPLYSMKNVSQMLMEDGQGSLNLTDLWSVFRKNII
jgi:hypothetical protein